MSMENKQLSTLDVPHFSGVRGSLMVYEVPGASSPGKAEDPRRSAMLNLMRRNQNKLATPTVAWNPLRIQERSRWRIKPLPVNLHSEISHAIVLQCSCRSFFFSVASITKSSAPSKVTVTWIFLMPLPLPLTS